MDSISMIAGLGMSGLVHHYTAFTSLLMQHVVGMDVVSRDAPSWAIMT